MVTSRYRIVDDQGNIGIEPLCGMTIAQSNGTYHGRLWVVQTLVTQDSEWQFLAAFRYRLNAEEYMEKRV